MTEYYTVQGGDSPSSVATKVYGSGSRMFQELINANPGPWKPGMRIVIPTRVENPFISNYDAARAGMATSTQLAAGATTANWTVAQALQNQAGTVSGGVLPSGAQSLLDQKISGVPEGVQNVKPSPGIGGGNSQTNGNLTRSVSADGTWGPWIQAEKGKGQPPPIGASPASVVAGAAGTLRGVGGVARNVLGSAATSAFNALKMPIGDFGTGVARKVTGTVAEVGRGAENLYNTPFSQWGAGKSQKTGPIVAPDGTRPGPSTVGADNMRIKTNVGMYTQQLTSGVAPKVIAGDELAMLGKLLGKNEQDALKWATDSGYTYDAKTDMWTYVPKVGSGLPGLEDVGGIATAGWDAVWKNSMAFQAGYGGGGGYYGSNESSTYTGRPIEEVDVNFMSQGYMNTRLASG